MKTMNVVKSLITVLILTVTTACSDDDKDTNNSVPDSRNVKYEITGNATGTFDATYITGSNTGANAIPTSLPWTKEIVAQAGNYVAQLNCSVTGATPGKTITAKIYVGGVLKKEQTETVQANGIAIIVGLQYALK